jgi:putative transposase
VELVHQVPANHRARDLAVPMPGDRYLKPQGQAWDVDEREDPAIAANVVSKAWIRERINKTRKEPLILHDENSKDVRAAKLERRLGELGVLWSFPRPRVSNDDQDCASLFRTVKHRPD